MTTVKKADLLEALRKNLKAHTEMVAEAKSGFLKEAHQKLTQAIQTLGLTAAPVTPISINLAPPDDHVRDYETAIAMMEKSVDDTVTLTVDQFRNYFDDDWDWTMSWAMSNRSYSKTVASYGSAKRLF